MGSPWVNGDFTFDLSDNLLFKKDEANYIDALGIQQLNTIGNIYFLDIFMSSGNSVELHYHPNASELTYCIQGEVEVAFINPNDNEWQTFNLHPGVAVSIPQGFWHYARALSDDVHLLATHDTNNLETIFGSDLLRVTPNEVFADIYCLNEEQVAEALAPITETVIIGPPADCLRGNSGVGAAMEEANKSTKLEKAKRHPNMPYATSFRQDMELGSQHNAMKTSPVYPPFGSSGEREQPVKFGGTVTREMNVCADCLRHYEA